MGDNNCENERADHVRYDLTREVAVTVTTQTAPRGIPAGTWPLKKLVP